MQTSLKSPIEQIAELNGRFAAQASRINDLERRITALEPKPPAPVRVPTWAKGGGENAGQNYAGPPSVDQKVVPRAVTYPIKIDGIFRNSAGEAVPDPDAPPRAAPVAPSDAKDLSAI
jgi:hypothetical protein